MSAFDIGALLAILATAIAIINERYLNIPNVIAQLLGAMIVSVALMLIGRFVDNPNFSAILERRVDGAHLPKILLDGILALLLFAGSLHANLSELRHNAASVLCLATLGVLLSCSIFTLSLWGILQACGLSIPLAWCFLLGAILAPTDAVAVEGLLRKSPLPEKLKSIVIGESLFNDGTAIVLFLAALASVAGQGNTIGHGRLLYAMVVEGGVGAAIGLATGFLVSALLSMIRDDEIAIFASLALALATYRLATVFGLSGPVAVVICGMVLSHRLVAKTEEGKRREKIITFWSLIDSLLNVLLFMLLGFEILALNFSEIALISAAAAIPLTLVSRYLSVAILFGMFGFSTSRDRRTPLLLTWLGLRGAISVALMQIVPSPAPYHEALLGACYAVVIFTIVVQGLLAPRVISSLYPSTD